MPEAATHFPDSLAFLMAALPDLLKNLHYICSLCTEEIRCKFLYSPAATLLFPSTDHPLPTTIPTGSLGATRAACTQRAKICAHLCILHIPEHSLCIQHIWELRHHLTFNGELLVEQGQVILQLTVGCDEDPLTFGIVLRPPSTPQHLRNEKARSAKDKSF